MAIRKSLPQLAHDYRNDPSVPDFPDDHPIIIFDGYCALCSGWVSFVLRHDRNCHYRLMTAQSAIGKALYRHYGLDPDDYETNVLLMDGFAWFKSEGSIRMAEGLGFPWAMAGVARVLPIFLRDKLYELVARNRFKWFGRKATCYMPSESVKNRFIN
jgi:predicted DCC family thiol-disulfide oxidoreductase YuxK